MRSVHYAAGATQTEVEMLRKTIGRIRLLPVT